MEQKQLRVGFGEAIKRAFSKYCCFSGRASCEEYWWFVLFIWSVSWGVGMCFALLQELLFGDAPHALDNAINTVSLIWLAIVLLPYLGLSCRRLHDIDKSGWNILVIAVPCVGWIIWLIWMCKPSDIWANEYGDVPNVVDSEEEQ